jgi:hypothetical protein
MPAKSGCGVPSAWPVGVSLFLPIPMDASAVVLTRVERALTPIHARSYHLDTAALLGYARGGQLRHPSPISVSRTAVSSGVAGRSFPRKALSLPPFSEMDSLQR